jgi:uncharacterized protein YjbI with pentapeptide repeats
MGEDGTILRTQNAIALCVIVILGFNWKMYEDLFELKLQLTEVRSDLLVIERLAQSQSLSRSEGVRNQILQTRNALYAVVPCNRNPGGMCPVTAEDGRRIEMVAHLVQTLGSRDLKGVNLQGLDLKGIDFSDVNLSYAQLDYSDLSGSNLAGVDFRHASMIGVDLTDANLDGAILVGSNLSGAGLENASLKNAQLQAADLRSAHACKADFSNSNLGATWFVDAILWGADFSDTHLSGDYRGASVDEETKWGKAPPEGIVTYVDKKNPNDVTLINAAYGPEVAPFLGGKPFLGTDCPKY